MRNCCNGSALRTYAPTFNYNIPASYQEHPTHFIKILMANPADTPLFYVCHVIFRKIIAKEKKVLLAKINKSLKGKRQ